MNHFAVILALAVCIAPLAQAAEKVLAPIKLTPLLITPPMNPTLSSTSQTAPNANQNTPSTSTNTQQNLATTCTPKQQKAGLCTPSTSIQQIKSLSTLAPVGSTMNPTAGSMPSTSLGGGGASLGGGGGIPPPNLIPLSAPAMPAAPAPGAETRPQHEPNQLILYWPDKQAATRDLARLNNEFGLAPSKKNELRSLGGVLATLHTDAQTDLTKLRDRLREALPQAAIDFNSLYYAEAGPRQFFAEQMNIETSDGPAVPVGMVDGEVSAIPALSQARIVKQSFLAPDEQAGAASHATSVAALIVGQDEPNKFRGVATQAPLFNAGIMRQQGNHSNTNSLLLARALDWLIGKKVKVINLSLGGAGDATMNQIFEKLRLMPVMIVAAAGNGGPSAAPSYPAAYPGVLAVTATNAAQAIYARANQGAYIAFAAPGEDVWVPSADGGQYVSGTSFASALTAGAIARLLAGRSTLNNTGVRKHLCDTARDLGETGPDTVFGCGLLQLAGALNGQEGGVATRSRHR